MKKLLAIVLLMSACHLNKPYTKIERSLGYGQVYMELHHLTNDRRIAKIAAIREIKWYCSERGYNKVWLDIMRIWKNNYGLWSGAVFSCYEEVACQWPPTGSFEEWKNK